jgi:hypothetical protein
MYGPICQHSANLTSVHLLKNIILISGCLVPFTSLTQPILSSRREAVLSLGGRPLGHHLSSSSYYHGKATSSLLHSQV